MHGQHVDLPQPDFDSDVPSKPAVDTELVSVQHADVKGSRPNTSMWCGTPLPHDPSASGAAGDETNSAPAPRARALAASELPHEVDVQSSTSRRASPTAASDSSAPPSRPRTAAQPRHVNTADPLEPIPPVTGLEAEGEMMLVVAAEMVAVTSSPTAVSGAQSDLSAPRAPATAVIPSNDPLPGDGDKHKVTANPAGHTDTATVKATTTARHSPPTTSPGNPNHGSRTARLLTASTSHGGASTTRLVVVDSTTLSSPTAVLFVVTFSNPYILGYRCRIPMSHRE